MGLRQVAHAAQHFPDPEMPKAIPYGVYDLASNEGRVNVGDDHDTPAFAVASIARWWERMGRHRYPDATRLMITAESRLIRSSRGER